MNCEECQDRVFELIEREAVDAAEVQAILNRCPACREEFDRLKSSIALAGHLPREEPPAQVDAFIAEMARTRRPASRAGDLKAKGAAGSQRFQPVPWAIAAVALLGIG
ncbi:MAG: hypothetical protein WBG86_11555, partial [Polyangiales bacterium]